MNNIEREPGSLQKKLFFSSSHNFKPYKAHVSFEKPGTRIGHYTIIDVLGEGGYGIVYLAEQQKPVKRQVALKVVKPGMDSKQVLARFEAERQALALLDHPNIAQIFDAGTTESGRPYFVMEHIKGLAVTEYCDTYRLSIDERLKVFLQICRAIQHAHQKGIIHRDIKPNNILVSTKEGQPFVKVIDFGVARALTEPLTDLTLHTLQGQIIGTPEYMSPEQADMDSVNIDTRSDVYSLGAVLYEALTGTQPYDPGSLRNSGLDTMRRMIAEQDPVRPSTRLLRLGDKANDIAEKRSSEIGILVKQLSRELEWIPLKAMLKDPEQRYQSASDLADDIENYLMGSPLIAGPESITYKIRKFVTKHRWSVASVLAVFVSLVAGVIVSLALYLDAKEARSNEENQRNIAESERDRATEAELKARQTLANLYEEQGRKYMDSGDLDKALLVLSEAYNIDNSKQSTKYLLSACMSKHGNPAIRGQRDTIKWPEKYAMTEKVRFAISSDRRLIALLTRDGESLEVFDTITGELKNTFFYNDIEQLVFAPTNKHIVLKLVKNKTHRTLKVLDLKEGKEVFSAKWNNVNIDRLLVDYDLSDREQMKSVFDSIYMNSAYDWLAFTDLVESEGQLEQQIRALDLDSGKQYTTGKEDIDHLIISLNIRPYSPYGYSKMLLALHPNHTVSQWEIPTLKRCGGFHWSGSGSVVWGPRGRTFLDLGSSQAELFDRIGNRITMSFPRVKVAGYSPDGKWIVTKTIYKNSDESEDHAADLWEVDKLRQTAKLSGLELSNWHFTPDSKFLVTEHDGGQVKVWWVEDGSLVFATPSEEHLMVTDISPDSTLFLTCDKEEPHTAKIWNINTGDCSEICQNVMLWNDLSDGLSSICLDKIFAFSGVPSLHLPIFNSDGLRLITGSGLQPLTKEIESPRQVQSLVRAYVPLRLEDGRFRPATTKEMLLAKWDYQILAGREGHSEAVNAALNVIVNEIETDELQKSGELGTKLKSWLPLEQMELTNRVQEVLRQLAEAYYSRADIEERQSQYTKAMADYETATYFCNDDPNMFNDLAWLQGTCPDEQLRDGYHAVENAKQACELTNWNHWEYLSTYAVCCAEAGEFDDAVRFQKKALDLMPTSVWDKWQANFEERLKLFRLGKPYERKLFLKLPGKNLIGWWRFEESKGTIAFDSSGHKHDGQFVGTPEWRHGKNGGAINCESEKSYVTISGSSTLDIVDAITVVAWIRTGQCEEEISNRTFIYRSNTCWRLAIDNQSNSLVFACYGLKVPSAYPDVFLIGKRDVGDNNWHQVSAVYNGASMLLYVDGVLDISTPASGSINTGSGTLLIGTGFGFIDKGWAGLIDDVRIYNRALSSEEIALLYEIKN